MIRINLLPIRQIKIHQQLIQQAIAFVVSLLVLCAGLGVTAITMGQKTTDLHSQINVLKNKKKSYQAIIAKINKLKKDQDALKSQLNAIKRLKVGSQQPVRILDAIASLTPSDRLWLKSLQHAPTSVKLSGVALDNATIAQYMKDLTASPYFAAANLGSTNLMQVGGRKLKSFTLTLTIQSDEPAETAEPKTGKKK